MKANKNKSRLMFKKKGEGEWKKKNNSIMKAAVCLMDGDAGRRTLC